MSNIVDLVTAVKASERNEPYFKQVIDEALRKARYQSSELNPNATLGEGNAYLTSVEYHPELNAAVAIIRDYTKDGKLAVVAAYQIHAVDDYYSFIEVSEEVFKDLASKDILSSLTNAPKELPHRLRKIFKEEYHQGIIEFFEVSRTDVALGYFQAVLNEVNIALMSAGQQPFRNWRDFYAAAVEGGFENGCGFKMGVSWHEYSTLTECSEPEIMELCALYGYRYDCREIEFI